MPYIKSTCRAGKTKEIGKYYTKRYHPERRGRLPKRNKTTEQQREINDRQLVRKLTRVLNANFNETSWYLTFSYAKEYRPESVDELKKHKRELLKGMRKAFKEADSELKYVETAEVGERGAVHIHMVINDIDLRKIKLLWCYGYVTAKPLDRSGQYRRLAEYFVKYYKKTRNTSEQIQKKAYNCSRNLIRPVAEKKKMKGERFSKEIRVPRGWYLDKDSVREGVTKDGYEFFFYTIIQEAKT